MIMSESLVKSIGFACAYTPLVLLDAAGFSPYRVLPQGDQPDQAGQYLHDNLCPHVKKILDRALSNNLPQLTGMVFVNSCDAMRRLADAWRKVRPSDKFFLVDFPVILNPTSIRFLHVQLLLLIEALERWKIGRAHV